MVTKMKNINYLYFSFLQLLKSGVALHHSLFASPSPIPVFDKYHLPHTTNSKQSFFNI